MEAIENDELRASRCERCGDVRFPPREVCASCGAEDLRPYTLKEGTATVVVDAGERSVGQIRTTEGLLVVGPVADGVAAGEPVHVVVEGQVATWARDA